MKKNSKIINTAGHGRKAYLGAKARGVLIGAGTPLMEGSVHVGGDFNSNDDISGGNSIGDNFDQEDIGTGGGANSGNNFWGEDIFAKP